MTRRATARPRTYSSTGRKSRSPGCARISPVKSTGTRRAKRRSRGNANSKSMARSSAIWRRRRAHRKPCSITSMPSCRRSTPASAARPREATMPEATLVEAVNMALARAMEEDPDVVVLGEDVGVNGGVFRATVGLQQRFGPERVIDTPLAELLISGICVGMAAQGLKPVGEIQFMGFAYPCQVTDAAVAEPAGARADVLGAAQGELAARAPDIVAVVVDVTRDGQRVHLPPAVLP